MRRSALLALVAGVAHSDDALVRCDLSAESGQLAAGLAKRGASCAAFAPVGPARGGGPVCLKALPQSGSTFSELAFSRVLEDACAAEAGCRFSKTDDDARAAWRDGAPTVFAYGKKHAPIQKDCPRSVVVLRDPRFRAASHLRYREQLKRKARARADLPDRVFAWDVSFALLSEARLLRDHVLDRVGGNATALLVRYEVLADGTYGPSILRDVDAFLGLAGRRGARLPAAAARRVANRRFRLFRPRGPGDRPSIESADCADFAFSTQTRVPRLVQARFKARFTPRPPIGGSIPPTESTRLDGALSPPLSGARGHPEGPPGKPRGETRGSV